jgi:hypothetical protein
MPFNWERRFTGLRDIPRGGHFILLIGDLLLPHDERASWFHLEIRPATVFGYSSIVLELGPSSRRGRPSTRRSG